jgi:hypothetical protein
MHAKISIRIKANTKRKHWRPSAVRNAILQRNPKSTLWQPSVIISDTYEREASEIPGPARVKNEKMQFLYASSARRIALIYFLSVTYAGFDVKREIASSTPMNQAPKRGVAGS